MTLCGFQRRSLVILLLSWFHHSEIFTFDETFTPALLVNMASPWRTATEPDGRRVDDVQ